MRFPLIAVMCFWASTASAVVVPISDTASADLFLGLRWNADGVVNQDSALSWVELSVSGSLDTETLEIMNDITFETGPPRSVMLRTDPFEVRVSTTLPPPSPLDDPIEVIQTVAGFHLETQASWRRPEIPESSVTQLGAASLAGLVLEAPVMVDFQHDVFLNGSLLGSRVGSTIDSFVRVLWQCQGPSSSPSCNLLATRAHREAKLQPEISTISVIQDLFAPELQDQIRAGMFGVIAAVPEPNGAVLLGLSLGAVAFLRRRDGDG